MLGQCDDLFLVSLVTQRDIIDLERRPDSGDQVARHGFLDNNFTLLSPLTIGDTPFLAAYPSQNSHTVPQVFDIAITDGPRLLHDTQPIISIELRQCIIHTDLRKVKIPPAASIGDILQRIRIRTGRGGDCRDRHTFSQVDLVTEIVDTVTEEKGACHSLVDTEFREILCPIVMQIFQCRSQTDPITVADFKTADRVTLDIDRFEFDGKSGLFMGSEESIEKGQLFGSVTFLPTE